MPLNENWIIQWSRFFDLGAASEGLLNHSRRIGPSHAGSLEVPAGFGFADDGAPKTLGHRDLLRGYSTRFWSVAALIEEIGRRQPGLVALSPLLSDFERTRDLIEAWLRRHRGTGKAALRDEEIQALRDDPPLVFFILFEAATQADGRRLGVLGSIIVAETLLREFLPTTSPATSPATAVPHAGIASSFDDVDNMPALLERLARRAGLEGAFPPFL